MGEAKRMAMAGIFGCSGDTMGRIAKALAMTKEELANSGLDLDMLDEARAIVEQGLAIDGLAVRARWPPGFLDAVAIAAGNLQMTTGQSNDEDPQAANSAAEQRPLRIEEGKNGEFAVYDDSAPETEEFNYGLIAYGFESRADAERYIAKIGARESLLH